MSIQVKIKYILKLSFCVVYLYMRLLIGTSIKDTVRLLLNFQMFISMMPYVLNDPYKITCIKYVRNEDSIVNGINGINCSVIMN